MLKNDVADALNRLSFINSGVKESDIIWEYLSETYCVNK